MSDVKFRDSERQLTLEDVNNVERSFGFVFPTQIREFYLTSNGGRPWPNNFKKDNECWTINEFYPIKYGKKGNLFEDSYYRLVLTGQEFFPPNLIPIGEDPGGDVYCFRHKGNKQGSICCWIADYYKNPERSVVDLSHDFRSFLDALV